MKILVVCGHSLGGSSMVEINAQKTLRQLNAPPDIEAGHSNTMATGLEVTDLFTCGRGLAENTERLGDVLVLDNILDKTEL